MPIKFKYTNTLFINVLFLALISLAATLRRDDFTYTMREVNKKAWLQGTWLTLTNEGRVYCQWNKTKETNYSGYKFKISESGDTVLLARYEIKFSSKSYEMRCQEAGNSGHAHILPMRSANKRKMAFESIVFNDTLQIKMTATENEGMIFYDNVVNSNSEKELIYIKVKN